MPRRRKSSPSRAVKSLEDDEELHHEIVNHDVYTHTVSSIEEDVAFRHSTVEQDVRRWHHEHELPVRRSSSRNKKNTSRRKSVSPKASSVKTNKKVVSKKSNASTTSSNNNEGSQIFKLLMEHFSDPIFQAYLILLIPALLFALVNMYFPGVITPPQIGSTRSETYLPSSSNSETTVNAGGNDMMMGGE